MKTAEKTAALTYSVNLWGSNPNLNDDNDDCWTGTEFTTLTEALAAAADLSLHFYAGACVGTAFIEIDGPDHYSVRANPAYRKPRSSDDGARSEAAMQAGMVFGCDGYNDAMGWGSAEEVF